MSAVTVSSSGVGIANLPNQKHRIVSNKGTNFTLMVCGKWFPLAKKKSNVEFVV
jgi:cell division control protein 12